MPLNPSIPLQTQGLDPNLSLRAFQYVRDVRQDDADRQQRETERRQAQKDRDQARADADVVRQDRDRERKKQLGVEEALRGAVHPDTGEIDWKKAAQSARDIDPVQAVAWWEKADQKALLQTKQRIDEQARVAGGLLNTDDANLGPAYMRERERLVSSGAATPDQIPDARTFQSPAQLRAFLQERLAAALDPKELYDTLEKKIMEAGKAATAKQYQTKEINWKGKPVSVPFDPDTGEYSMPDGTKSKFANNYVKPESGGGGAAETWRNVKVKGPDGKVRTVAKRVRDGDVIDEDDAGPTEAEKRKADADKRRADAWKVAELAGVERKFREGEIELAELEKRKLEVENQYRAKMGEDPISGLDEKWAWTPKGSAEPQRAAAPMGPSAANAAPTQPATNAPSTPTRNNSNPPQNTSRGSFRVTAPNGKTYTFATQAAADEFKRRAGL